MSQLQLYNGQDTIATLAVWHKLREQLDASPEARATYNRAMCLEGPLLYAMFRGILIDQDEAAALRKQFVAEARNYERILDSILKPLRMGAINLGSGHQLKWMFACLNAKLPAPSNYKSKSASSVDAGALEKLMNREPDLAPICRIILGWRDRAKMLQVLNPSRLGSDGRMRTFYKVAGTTTGRLASAMDVMSHRRKKVVSGMNMQNIKRDEDEERVHHASIRSIFVADPGRKFLNIDLERADSWIVALEVFKATGDTKFLEAAAGTDLHTFTSKLIWPDLGWTGDPVKDKAIAEGFFYRQYDYRFMAKKLNHGGPYLGSPRGLATQMKIPLELAEQGFRGFFGAFPAIRKWHHIKAKELQLTGSLTNILGRKRNFHGRLDSDSTLRQAIAFLGQSGTAEVINRALLRLWAVQIQMPDLGMEFLAQVHDSVLLQYPEANEQEVVETALQVMAIPITVTSPQGETITVSIPLEASVGWNWAKRHKNKQTGRVSNPDGLVNLKAGQTDGRKRHKLPPRPSIAKPRLVGAGVS